MVGPTWLDNCGAECQCYTQRRDQRTACWFLCLGIISMRASSMIILCVDWQWLSGLARNLVFLPYKILTLVRTLHWRQSHNNSWKYYTTSSDIWWLKRTQHMFTLQLHIARASSCHIIEIHLSSQWGFVTNCHATGKFSLLRSDGGST